MKRIKKQAVLESITLLENANEYVTADLKPDELLNILTQCQEAAILTGNDLETQGENTKELVTMLEEYCELIFQISQSMDDPESRKQLAQNVRNLLIRLHSKTVELLPEDRKEIVFLPYKASMWDSLESVWKAADADPECDAYVIPIPYYDKNPDGSFREMHYEGDLFPDYVPITKYDAYSLEERRPDAIYIHNPYDGANYVTSVHPDYYSDKLKQYTDELVYIPYFVLAEIDKDDQKKINKMVHFILTTGVVYADKVIVQSEKMRSIYIKEYLNWTRSSRLQGKYIDEELVKQKILGIGSPKFDKAVNVQKDQYIIPADWQKLIENKKILFINTSIVSSLAEGEQELEVLSRTFKLLSKKKDWIVWWRPHPLLQSTYASMRPDLLDTYQKLVIEFKKNNYGIYDETSDLYRALAYSDKYYGDASSIVRLFGAAGKQCMISIYHWSERSCMKTNHWLSFEIEKDDLINWLDGKQQWILTKKFTDEIPEGLLDGNTGKRIHKRVMNDIK